VVKYIGDASLLVFPEEEVDGAVRELLAMKGAIERYFALRYPDLSITFSAHLGEIIIVRLEPFSGLDILGDTVNSASRLGRQARGGGFAISREVYARLSEATRRRFRSAEDEGVYLAE
jgi:class 3 adenylate cyclase